MLTPEADCSLCPRLCESRTSVVTGEGPSPCEILIIAEAPSGIADATVEPMAGWTVKALKYLVTEVAMMDWSTVRLTYATKCRPPRKKGKDSKPTAAEAKNCLPFLMSEIEEVKPRLIITLGALPTKVFFPKANFNELRGKRCGWEHPTLGEIDVFPSYNPDLARPGRNPALAKTMEAEWGGLTKEDTITASYRYVSGAEAADLFACNLYAPFAFDFETKRNHWPHLEPGEKPVKKVHTFQAIRSIPIGWSFCFEEGTAYYVTDSISSIKTVLEDADWPKYVHNATFEYTVCQSEGITLRGFGDTKAMAFLLGYPDTGLKNLSSSLLGIKQTRFDEVNWDNIQEVVNYGSADSDYTFRIKNILEPLLRGSERLLEVYDNIDIPAVAPISAAQRSGFLVDTQRLADVRRDVGDERDKAFAFLVKEYTNGDELEHIINLNSPQQLGDWLYGDPETGHWKKTAALKTRSHIRWTPPGLGLTPPGFTDDGQPKTDINSLHALSHPVAETLIKFSSAEQFLGGQSKAFLFLPQEDGRIHPSYHLTGHWETDDGDATSAPSTGRLSSTGPNAQQITNYGDDSRPYVFQWGQELRRCINPAPGFVFLEADFAQQEPRIGAVVSGDAYMDHLLQTADVYKPAASDLYSISTDEVSKDQRQIGKRAWMAWLNRAGPSGIQRSAWWLSTEEAQVWLNTQHTTYATFTEWCQETFQFLLRHGYVETWYGRRIYIPSSQSSFQGDRDKAYRACIPGVIQGSGADVFKLCLAKVSPYIYSIGGKIPNLVHDSITCEVKEEDAQVVAQFLKDVSKDMLPSPLPIEVLMGTSWSKLDMVEV